MKKKARSVSTLFILSMVVVTTLSVTMLGYYLITQEYTQFSESNTKIRDEFINTNKQIIKYEVQSSVDYINFRIKESRNELKSHIKEQLYQGYQILEYLYDEYKFSMPESELKELLISVLRSFKYNTGRGYYSVTNGDGKALLLQSDMANNPLEAEGVNRLNQKDVKGFYFVREFIKVAKNQGEGFVEYYRIIPNDPSRKPYLKVSFVKYFEPFDWIIATGDYLDS